MVSPAWLGLGSTHTTPISSTFSLPLELDSNIYMLLDFRNTLVHIHVHGCEELIAESLILDCADSYSVWSHELFSLSDLLMIGLT